MDADWVETLDADEPIAWYQTPLDFVLVTRLGLSIPKMPLWQGLA